MIMVSWSCVFVYQLCNLKLSRCLKLSVFVFLNGTLMLNLEASPLCFILLTKINNQNSTASSQHRDRYHDSSQ